MNKVSLISISLSVLTSGLAFGGQADGHAGGNGGDPVLLRAKMIRQYVNSDLRNDVRKYFETLDLSKITNFSARGSLQMMKDRDVLTDIADSNYTLRDSCSEVGGQAAGGAMPNDLGGDICLSPRRLAEIGSSKAEIVGLAVHEYAHHFGYSDKDYAIYKAVFSTVILAEPDWKSSTNGSGSVQAPPILPAPAPISTPTPTKSDPIVLNNPTVNIGSQAYPFCYPYGYPSLGDPAIEIRQKDGAAGICRSLGANHPLNFKKSWGDHDCAIMNGDGSVRSIAYGFTVTKVTCN